MARDYHYHCYHRDVFDALPEWDSSLLTVPRIGGGGYERKRFYSLKKDMDSLRALGASKGIVDSSVTSVGTTTPPVNGYGMERQLWALKVGNGAAHKVLFTGAHHSREWISVEVPYLVAEYLIQNYTSTPSTPKERRIHHLVNNREIWFVPMVNPDGHDYTTTSEREWRANRKGYRLPAATITPPRFGGGTPRTITYPAAVYYGVDVNRNYPTTEWGQESFSPDGTVRTSGDPRDGGANSTWFGPSANSELETQANVRLYTTHRFRASLSYHNFSQLLLFPDSASGDMFCQTVGSTMNELIAAAGVAYTYQASSALYPTTGSSMAYSFEAVPGRPTYTIELRPPRPAPAGWDFSGLPESEIEPCFRENLGAALALINCAGHDIFDLSIRLPTTSGAGSSRIQIVANCVEAFRGWTP
jgi:hypothetical protein